MLLLPRPRREALFALYDVARAIDDVADGPGTPDERRAGLDRWRAEIAAIYDGVPTHPAARALQPFARAYGLPRAELDALLDGQFMDLEAQRFDEPTFVLYCRRVAGTIGLLALPIFGASGPAAEAYALALGEALQRINVLRDIEEDAARGRDYLPEPRTDFARRAREKLAAAQAMVPADARRALRPAIVMGELYAALLARLPARRLGWIDKLRAVLRGIRKSR